MKFLHATLAPVVLTAALLLAAGPCVAAGNATAPAAENAAVQTGNNATAPAATQAQAPQSRLAAAIAAGIADGKVDAAAAPGFLGIPGGPQVSPILAFVWALWVGWIFSTVGAFGGVMAGVGHMSVFGFGQYAGSFGKGAPLNKVVTDSIRVSNQWLVGCSSLVSSFKYWSMGRIVLPLGIAMGVGSLAGSWLVPTLTHGKVSFHQYQGWFGLFVLLLGCYLLYETMPHVRAKKKKAAEAAKAFEAACKTPVKDGAKLETGVKIVAVTPAKVVFTFCGIEFSFNPLLPVGVGFIVAAMAAFLGVGGGFLLVPFLTSITQLPMYLAAGTSAFVVLVGMITSISTFMSGGTPVYWPLVGVELVGIVVGSWVGPMTAKYLPDVWLKRLFILLAFVVGLDYTLRGFFSIQMW